jgi:hypothetical protein
VDQIVEFLVDIAFELFDDLEVGRRCLHTPDQITKRLI